MRVPEASHEPAPPAVVDLKQSSDIAGWNGSHPAGPGHKAENKAVASITK